MVIFPCTSSTQSAEAVRDGISWLSCHGKSSRTKLYQVLKMRRVEESRERDRRAGHNLQYLTELKGGKGAASNTEEIHALISRFSCLPIKQASGEKKVLKWQIWEFCVHWPLCLSQLIVSWKYTHWIWWCKPVEIHFSEFAYYEQIENCPAFKRKTWRYQGKQSWQALALTFIY